MTGKPTDPDDANHTTLYDPPPPTPPETPAPPPETPPETPAPPPETLGPAAGDLGPAAGDLGPAARRTRHGRTAHGRRPAPSPTTPRSGPMWRSRDNDGRTGTIVLGVILVAIGLWFFGDQTLGLDMPELSWSELWPILIIGLGGWIVLGSLRRDA